MPLRLSFLPKSVDFGLLVLRLGFGLPMLILHGWPKVGKFATMAPHFNYFGVPPEVNLGLVIFAEVVCAALIAIGLFSRLAALVLTINMSVAFFIAHSAAFTGEKPGEMAYLYLAAYFVILIAGPGKFSADRG